MVKNLYSINPEEAKLMQELRNKTNKNYKVLIDNGNLMRVEQIERTKYYLLNPTWQREPIEITTSEAVKSLNYILFSEGFIEQQVITICVDKTIQYLQVAKIKEKSISFRSVR